MKSKLTEIRNKHKKRTLTLEMQFFKVALYCTMIVFFSNIVLTHIRNYNFYARITSILAFITLVIIYIISLFITTQKQQSVLNVIFSICINVIVFPLLYIFSGGIHSAVILYFILSNVITVLLLTKKQLLIIYPFEITAQIIVIALSYFYSKPSKFFMIVSNEKFAAVSIGCAITGIALGILLRIMANAFEKERTRVNTLVDELEDLTVRDALTGTYNRRYLMSTIDLCIKKVENGELNTFSVIMYDLDHFKSVNDTYGHVVGDEVLKNFAKILRKNLRSNDILARYGGEEFIIVLPNASDVTTFRRAEQIRLQVEANKLSNEMKSRVTVSGGVFEYDKIVNAQQLIENADKNLYLAKETGRNKIVWKNGAPAPVCYSVFK